MSVDLTQAKTHLNITDTTDDTELTFFLAAANEWVAMKVSDTTSYPVQLGTLELIRHWWETQRGPAAGPLDEDDEVDFTESGFAIPRRVKELLGPYLTATAPTGSFPDALDWPDPVEC